MIFAAVRDTGYNIVLTLHIVSVMAAFAPMFVHPILTKQGRSIDDKSFRAMLVLTAGNGRRIYAPALILGGLLGFALQGMSDGVWAFDQSWFLSAVILWVAMNGVLHGLIFPAERALAGGDDAAEKRLDVGGMLITLMFIAMVLLMVDKPGL